MINVEVVGAEKFATLAKALRQAGDKDLQRELYAALNRSTKPLKADAKASAAATLPSRGGLGKRVAKTRMTTKRRTGRNPSVSIAANPGAVADPKRIDRGRIKHPVFGRGPWVLQDVPWGWFTRPMHEGASEVRKQLVKAIDDVAAKVARSV